MAIIDAKLELCDATAVGTSIAGAAPIGNHIDLGARRDFYDAALTPDIGEAGDMWLNVKVATTFATSASAVITLALYHHTAAATASAIVSSGAVVSGMTVTTSATPTSAAGTTLIRTKLPAGTINRYVVLASTIATAAMTAGAVDAWISMDGETPL